MTARERLLALRRTLTAIVLLRAALVGTSVAIVAGVAAHALALPRGATILVVTLGVFAAIVVGRRARASRSLQRVALWVEERHPALRYALVTAADRGAVSTDVESQANATPWWEIERRRLLGLLVAPVLALLAALALLAWRPVLATPDMTTVAGARRGARDGARPIDPLAAIHISVSPPAYSGRAATTLDDPSSVDALVASRIIVSGEGDAALVRAALDSLPRGVVARAGGWSVTIPMPPRAALIHLRSMGPDGRERLVVLAPIVDAPPAVTLVLPARDTVVRVATGLLTLRARLRDDIGLRDGEFEIIVSSGQEENFTFRSLVLARTALGGRLDGALESRLSLDSLALRPGDVLQLRAVARDANDATGPGIGSSETRALRVARAGEYDSVAIEAAAPADPEGQGLSQRMLITLTEALQSKRRSLDRPTLLAESHRIALDQARLRKRVGDIVFQRTGADPLAEEGGGIAATPAGKVTPEQLLELARQATGADAGSPMDVEGDETPILAINKPLLEAFNAMWDAGRALEQGSTAQALPPMRRALAAIERARQAERIYLRGRPAAVIVDVARARLTGKDKGSSRVREPRVDVDPIARRRAETFARASALLATDAGAAADSLLVLRVGALGDSPALAATLDSAARITRRGSAAEVEIAWARVRRALGGAPRRRDSLPAWGGGDAP